MKCVALAFGALAAVGTPLPEPATAQGMYQGRHGGQTAAPARLPAAPAAS